jgi:exodeoxyribonuclease VIII
MANAERLEGGTKIYHAHPGISSSKLSDYKESPKLFYERHIAKSMPSKAETPLMRRGTLGHLCALEPKIWSSKVTVAPICDRRTKDGKAEYSAWRESLDGDSIEVSAEEKAYTEKMVQAIKDHSLARKYVFDLPAEAELPIRWDCDESELVLKGLLDRFGAGIIVDLKFIGQPKPTWWKSYQAKDRGYHRQAAHYLQGAADLVGVNPSDLRFLFICVQNEPPFDIYCCELEDEFLKSAAEELRILKHRLRLSMDCNLWFPPNSLSLNKISQPLWAWDETHNTEEAA